MVAIQLGPHSKQLRFSEDNQREDKREIGRASVCVKLLQHVIEFTV